MGQTRSPHPLQRALQVPLPLQPHGSACQREPRAAAMGECRAGEGSLRGTGRDSEHCPDGDRGHQRTQRAALPCTPVRSCFGSRIVFL